ncbi:CoA transferase subunit A [Pseudomonas sp. P66]|uniref:3-oxoadipate CoA-transferase n=1 Tax=Pseudomonas arcuscaelestis TaxID=2710591 RepID=A0ABS2BSM3_9PSED|nr:CoA-transferase [Pseudomonas arcuscaelestis]MBM3103874.1 CoA transferase subunit A [Pseudomonas arcuscaelestis]MBM3111209.1 CoA transferase subunit A [Pseudomonas arcuscaelestis]MBM5456632.1 CoA transferase subunit A [Pseudomonas arcuscaelestis]
MNKQMTAADAVAQLRDGMTIGFGGWGPRRKPMAVVREILRSPVKDLTVVAYGGPEVGMLCAAGKVKKLVFGFATLDAIPLEPYYRKAREAGGLELLEVDEGMFQWGLRAAAMRLPFLPTRCGLATDVTRLNPALKTIASPYDDGEVLLAMPALNLDVAFVHVNVADRLGNTLVTGPDPYFDHLFARAAQQCFVSCEQLHERLELTAEQARCNTFERYLVSGVIHAPFGAHPTACQPEYGWDLSHLKHYAASAGEEGGWQAYVEAYVVAGELAYQDKNGGAERMGSLALPVF